ncbi:hypothetical protein [Lunatibacter salilacus]|uniref:hypothetical protein n=1 Tax=Lunatibacter salilacus TaxID=2483804 RepID=UPI00131C06C9|nr:hypothetical protein [Lunatibacter salilacus]
MKNLLLLIMILFGFQAVQAQGYYLPVSTDSDAAKQYYMNVKDYKKSIQYYEKALELGMEVSRERAEEVRLLIEESK